MARVSESKKNQLITMFEEARKGYEFIKEDYTILEMAYKNMLTDEKIEDLKRRRKSMVLPKKIYAKVRRVVISIMNTYFENDEFAKLVPFYPSDKEIVSKMQEVFDDWFNKKVNFYTRIRPIVRDALVYGTCFAKVYWSNNRLQLIRVSPRDAWIDPNADSIFDIQYLVNRVVTTIGALKRIYGNKKALRQFIGASLEYPRETFDNVDVGDASRIEVYDIYRKINGKWYVSTMLPDYTFLRVDDELKDGIPFVIGIVENQLQVYGEKTIKALGYPIIDLLIPLQETYTILLNQELDAIDKQLNPQFMATKVAGVNESQLTSNRKVIYVNDLNQIREMPQINISQSVLSTEKLDTEMQEVSGISKLAQGLIDKGVNTTATGMTILSRETNLVIEDIIKSLNESFFEPLIKRIILLLWKYDENPLLYGVNRNANPLFKVSINTGVGATNKEVLLQSITTAEQTAIQNLQLSLQMQDMDRAKMYSEVLDKLFEKKLEAINFKTLAKDFKNEINEIEELKNQMEEMQIQQMEQQAQQPQQPIFQQGVENE